MSTPIMPGGGSGSSFEDPISILLACHDRVRHFARLTQRLEVHVATHGADDEASEAAARILRYFNVAAPLHYADEEEDLFPALRGLARPVLNNAIHSLESDHAALEALWNKVEPWLRALERHEAAKAPAELSQFAMHHVRHTDREELDIYDAIRALPASTLQEIGVRMRARRGATD